MPPRLQRRRRTRGRRPTRSRSRLWAPSWSRLRLALSSLRSPCRNCRRRWTLFLIAEGITTYLFFQGGQAGGWAGLWAGEVQGDHWGAGADLCWDVRILNRPHNPCCPLCFTSIAVTSIIHALLKRFTVNVIFQPGNLNCAFLQLSITWKSSLVKTKRSVIPNRWGKIIKSEKLSLISSVGRDSSFACQQGPVFVAILAVPVHRRLCFTTTNIILDRGWRITGVCVLFGW